MKLLRTLLWGLLSSYCLFIYAQESSYTTLEIDVQNKLEPMKPIWAWFGYDEPNYTYMKDGKKLLTELSELSYVPVNVRVHNLLTTGDGTPALKWGSTCDSRAPEMHRTSPCSPSARCCSSYPPQTT